MKKRSPGRKGETSNIFIQWSIVAVFAGLLVGTMFHDPILHGLMAKLFGWDVESYETGIMTGSTTVIAPKTATTGQFWWYYMFPSVAIYALVFIGTVFSQDRRLMVVGTILLALNLPSFVPSLAGSDSANALEVLTKSGYSESAAMLSHLGIMLAAFTAIGLYLYIVIDNNQKDAQGRIRNIYR